MRSLALGVLVALLITAFPAPSNAQTSTTDLRLACDGSVTPTSTVVRKMETSLFLTYVDYAADPAWNGNFGGCWAHVGIQNYFVGVEKVYRFNSIEVHVTVAEDGDSPPMELPTTPGAGSLGYPIFVETSVDGKTWTKAAEGVASPLTIDVVSPQQDITISKTYAPGTGPEFRFLRVRGPQSVTQGLSGFIDYAYTCDDNAARQCLGTASKFTLNVSEVSTVSAVSLTSQTDAPRSCAADIMESPIALHPCWYGGINHYDSASALHTYFLQDSRLDRIKGSATLNYWRYTDPLAADAIPGGLLGGKIVVEASANGTTWTKIGEVSAPHGQAVNFDFPNLGALEAKFVRLESGKDRNFDDYYHVTCSGSPPTCNIDRARSEQRRMTGYLLDSSLLLSGDLPAP